MSIEEQLTCAFLISTEMTYFGFMFSTSDLTGHVRGDVNSSSSKSLGSPEWLFFTLWFLLVFCCQVSSQQKFK